MKTLKHFILYLALFTMFVSCSEDNDTSFARNLQEYIDTQSGRETAELIACAAASTNSLSYIFYYPIEGAVDIRYYEAESVDIDENDFSKYRRIELAQTPVLGGKLARFSRSETEENWCIVTYLTDGKLHISDPIRLKNETKTTEWKSDVTIEYTETLKPKFIWEDGSIEENVIYFQAIVEKDEDKFVSGTYTLDKFFQYFDDSNVVLTINTPDATPEDLEVDKAYEITLMGISEDNWVNLVIEKSFVPRNLQEYITANSTSVQEEMIAFGASASNNDNLTYIYYYPISGATEIRYYETEGTDVDENDFSKYRRKFISSSDVFGGKLERFSRSSSVESWCVVTYLTNGKFHTSKPIRIKNKSKQTEWKSELIPEFPESLMPKFTWTDGMINENVLYFQGITKKEDDTFISGTFTLEKTFQFYDTSNVSSHINETTPEALVLASEYNFTLMGISEDNWVNLLIQDVFIAE